MTESMQVTIRGEIQRARAYLEFHGSEDEIVTLVLIRAKNAAPGMAVALYEEMVRTVINAGA